MIIRAQKYWRREAEALFLQKYIGGIIIREFPFHDVMFTTTPDQRLYRVEFHVCLTGFVQEILEKLPWSIVNSKYQMSSHTVLIQMNCVRMFSPNWSKDDKES